MSVTDRASLRSVYLYLICLVTLVISIFAGVSVVRNAVELVYPDPGYYGVEREYEQQAEQSQRRSAVVGLVGSSSMLLIAGPVYLYHWRRVQAEQTGARSVTV